MKLNQLLEMTIQFGKVNPLVSSSLLDQLKSGNHIGKIDGLDVIQQDLSDNFIGLGLSKGDKIVAGLIYKDKKFAELYFIHSLEQNNGNASRLLWFLKDTLKKSIIDYGALSDDGLKFITSISKTKRFKISWYNVKSLNQEPFDQLSGKIAFDKKTDWRVMIEQSEETLDDPLGIITLFESPAP